MHMSTLALADQLRGYVTSPVVPALPRSWGAVKEHFAR